MGLEIKYLLFLDFAKKKREIEDSGRQISENH